MNLKPWQTLVLESLDELSDSSFQTRVWLQQDPNQVSSPVESINQLFDDSGLLDLLEKGTVFSESADEALRHLSEHVDTIDFSQTTKDLLATAAWQALQRLALVALAEVRAALQAD